MKYMLGMAALVVIAPLRVHAATADDFQIWSSLQLSGSISGPIVGSLELSGRLTADASRLGVAIVRPTIGYELNKSVTMHLGYAHQTTVNEGRRDVQENRVFQQLNWAIGKVGTGALSSRTRFEQRFVNTGNDTGLRARFQLRYSVPLKAKGTTFILSSEPFFALNTTDWGQRAGLDQWRNFVGVGIPVTKSLTLDTGFQHRYQKRFNQPDRSDFIIPVTLQYRF